MIGRIINEAGMKYKISQDGSDMTFKHPGEKRWDKETCPKGRKERLRDLKNTRVFPEPEAYRAKRYN